MEMVSTADARIPAVEECLWIMLIGAPTLETSAKPPQRAVPVAFPHITIDLQSHLAISMQ